MSRINNEHNIYLKVLTPVHIGGAQEKNLQENLDYIQLRNGSTWKLDWKRVYQTFDPEDIAEAIVNKKLDRLIENEIEDVAVEIEQTFGDTGEIRAFIRDGLGKAYLPGSSIKGAMKNWTYSALESKFQKKKTKGLLGSFDSNVFRFIEPSDCIMKDEVELYPTKIFNLRGKGYHWEGGWKHNRRNNTTSFFSNDGFVTDYECFSPGSTGKFNLRLREKLSDYILEKLYSRNYDSEKSYKEIFQGKALSNLFDLINQQTKKHIKRELAFFSHFNEAEYSEDVIAQYEILSNISKKLNGDKCLLRLSAGSGFHGITGDFQFPDHTKTGFWTRGRDNGKIRYKSRKIAFTPNEMYPMGFVLLSTQPIETNLYVSQEKAHEKKVPNSRTETKAVKPKTQLKYEIKDARELQKGDMVFGEIIKLGKPFCEVKLFLSNYKFSGESDLSGTKKFHMEVGQIVKCQLGAPSKNGEFKQVRFIP